MEHVVGGPEPCGFPALLQLEVCLAQPGEVVLGPPPGSEPSGGALDRDAELEVVVQLIHPAEQRLPEPLGILRLVENGDAALTASPARARALGPPRPDRPTPR